jgi:DNA-binding transcriptional ArsR family regulator
VPRPLVDEEQKVIEDLGALKALADPQRLTLLLAMGEEPRTVKQVAAQMGVPPTRLYYHVRMLAKYGLLEVASTRMVSGIEERSYQATAKSWTVSTGLLSSAIARSGVVKAMFDVASAELQLALGSSDAPLGDMTGNVPVLSYSRFVLSPEQLAEVKEKIEQLMIDYGAVASEDDDQEYNALLAVFKKP